MGRKLVLLRAMNHLVTLRLGPVYVAVVPLTPNVLDERDVAGAGRRARLAMVLRVIGVEFLISATKFTVGQQAIH
jgi:hypothetical protein